MKKIIPALIGALTLIALASCSNSDSNRDLSANDCQIGKDWGMTDESYFQNILYEPEDKSGSYYTVITATDLNDSVRMTTVNINDKKEDSESYNILYASTSLLSATYQQYVIDALKSKTEAIEEQITSFDASIQESWKEEKFKKSDVCEMSNPTICIFYIPVELKVYTYSKKETSLTARVFAFAPVYSVIANEINESFDNDLVNSFASKTITFQYDSSTGAVA